MGFNAFGAIFLNGSWTPKLALDLEGGTQIILAPQLENGQAVSAEQLTQAVGIIRQRIDAAGVSESEVNTQGNSNLVVSIPGKPDEDTLNRIESSAKLDFRPVLVAGAPTNEVMGADGKPTPAPSPDPGLAATPAVAPTNASDLGQVTPSLKAHFEAFSCASETARTTNIAPSDQPLITCEKDNSAKYILGPVEVEGRNITNASSALKQTQTGASTGQWAVHMTFDGTGTEKFASVTTRLSGLTGAQNQFAIVLDGKVISAPKTNSAITDGKPEISGNFTQSSAKSLADQLKFGALPIGFKVQSSDTISATLGSTQLTSGLVAGLIGLVLVVLYSFAQYRLLGLVTVASLTIAAIIAYMVVTVLSWRNGYRLSLAGVTGLIVAIGITADSFIVYFERIRDELRDGRALESGVEAGWRRALRTILASDAVNFLAAGVLFVLAVGNVRGFALTLGLTTIIDVIVVGLFTHPVLRLLAQMKFFNEGHRWSGLDPRALGAIYRGRTQFREPTASLEPSKKSASAREATKRQTIAQRKAAEVAVAPPKKSKSKGKDA